MPHESTVNPHEFSNEQQYGSSKKSSRASSTTGNMEEKASSTVPSLLAASAIAEADHSSRDAQNLNDNKVLAFNVRTPVPQSQNPGLSSRPQTPNVLNHDFDDDSDEDDADL